MSRDSSRRNDKRPIPYEDIEGERLSTLLLDKLLPRNQHPRGERIWQHFRGQRFFDWTAC
jgi:hypothetical protein